jgi:hypothetical protein
MSPCKNLDPIFQPVGAHVALREPGHVRVVLDAHGARAEVLRRRDGDLAIARAEVVHHVLCRDGGHRQHAMDQRVVRGAPHTTSLPA